mmetsp:Transcript_100551/g.284814  ORF Transcript_100551/g.284814 Transcript_100551/m.284814 type:complete len:799 (-) Transcript_100551:244-2640(-)
MATAAEPTGCHRGLFAKLVLALLAVQSRAAHQTFRGTARHLMQRYWTTSHSIAVVVPMPHVEPQEPWFQNLLHTEREAPTWVVNTHDPLDQLGSRPASGQPWWWITAVRVKQDEDTGRGIDGLPWTKLVKAFLYKMNSAEKRLLIDKWLDGNSKQDDFHIPDPKVQTIRLDVEDEVLFRAMPQGRCDNHTLPPEGSFLPVVLPPVPSGQCVLELCNLSPGVEYRLLLFNVSDGALPPTAPPSPIADATTWTSTKPWIMHITLSLEKVCAALAMLLAVILQSRKHCVGARNPTNYSQVVTPEDGVGGFHQVKVRNLFLSILKDLLVALTMFLPLVGPLGLILASDVVLGVRMRKVMRSRERLQGSDDKLKTWFAFLLGKDLFILAVNVVMLPINIYAVQKIWFMYGRSFFSRVGLDLLAEASFSGFQRYDHQWQEVSGLELVCWVPFIVLSSLMLAVDLQNDDASLLLRKHKRRAESLLNELPKGRELWAKLCAMDGALFGGSGEAPEGLWKEPCRLLLGVLFGMLPHIWMSARHGVALWNGTLMWNTLMYVVNIGGLAARFQSKTERICVAYRTKCSKLATFQALSWQEDRSTAIYDPFATRNQAVVEARKRLRENIPKISTLKLEEPEDSKVWWHLRELVLIEIKDGRIMMEMMVLLCIAFTVLQGLSSLVVMLNTQQVTSTTLVTVVVLVVGVWFTYNALSSTRDINLMSEEHTCLLHNVVAEMNMPLRAQMPLDSHLQQARFLLQVATLIEKVPPPETIASFAVTPQLFSLVLGTIGTLTALCIYNLIRGLLELT